MSDALYYFLLEREHTTNKDAFILVYNKSLLLPSRKKTTPLTV